MAGTLSVRGGNVWSRTNTLVCLGGRWSTWAHLDEHGLPPVFPSAKPHPSKPSQAGKKRSPIHRVEFTGLSQTDIGGSILMNLLFLLLYCLGVPVMDQAPAVLGTYKHRTKRTASTPKMLQSKYQARDTRVTNTHEMRYTRGLDHQSSGKIPWHFPQMSRC